MSWGRFIGLLILLVLIIVTDVVLTPGLIITLPGNSTWVSLWSLENNYYAIAVHSVIKAIVIGLTLFGYTYLIGPVIENMGK